MRQPTDNCLLCQENPATQPNSHIIPKFFGQGLFYSTKPRHAIVRYKTGEIGKAQDTVKENYLFCPNCEKGFNVYETYCALRLERFNNPRFSNQFEIHSIGDFKYFECKSLDIKIFNLFIYSIVWRISISENYAFRGFKLAFPEEEKLRLLLKNYTQSNQE
jgi:hypothetical protein